MANWYVARNNKKSGPFTPEQLKQLATTRRLLPTDMLLKEGTVNWVAASEVNGLLAQAVTAPSRPATAVRGKSPPRYIGPRPSTRIPWLLAGAGLAAIVIIVGVVAFFTLGKKTGVTNNPKDSDKVAARNESGSVETSKEPSRPETKGSGLPEPAARNQDGAKPGVVRPETPQPPIAKPAEPLQPTPGGPVAAERPATPAERPQPPIAKPKQDKGATHDDRPNAQTERIVAEGLGATPDEALKDAFRNAVRQVVGAVVDAETLVKNDEVISDKVLTYSDGFISKCDEISKTQDKGLFRIKIAANVERRSVVAKLKAANVTVKDVDGGGLFAKEITTAEAQKNATELLKNNLKDLPNLLTAEVSSKPTYDRDKSEAVFDVTFKVDQKAYAAFQERLVQVLKKVRLREVSATVAATRHPLNNSILFNKENALTGPKLTDKENNAWCVWVNTFHNQSHTTTKWDGFVVDGKFGEALESLRGHHIVTFSLLDKDGQLVTEDESPVPRNSIYTKVASDLPPGQPRTGVQRHLQELPPTDRPDFVMQNTCYPFLWRTALRDGWLRITGPGGNPGNWADHIKAIDATLAERKDLTAILYISPYSLTVVGGGLYYQPMLVLQSRVKVPLAELKQIDKISCKVRYSEEPFERRRQ